VLTSGTANRESSPNEALVTSPDTAGSCWRMLDGTVKLPAEARAVQLNPSAE